jgi:hypothetical protein
MGDDDVVCVSDAASAAMGLLRASSAWKSLPAVPQNFASEAAGVAAPSRAGGVSRPEPASAKRRLGVGATHVKKAPPPG